MPCHHVRLDNGITALVRVSRSRRKPVPCAECGQPSGYQCDFKTGPNTTCDKHLCCDHAVLMGPNLHYCLAHHTADLFGGGVIDERIRLHAAR